MRNRHTYTQDDYCNPLCACAPRVITCLILHDWTLVSFMAVLTDTLFRHIHIHLDCISIRVMRIGLYLDSRNADQILLPTNPDLIRIPFTCAKKRWFRCSPYTVDGIHLLEINKGRIQAITTLPVVVFDFSKLCSQVLDLGLALPPPPVFS